MTKNVTSHTVALAANVASVSAVCLPGCCARHDPPTTGGTLLVLH